MPYDTAFYAPALWARVRDDYLAGESADAVCARHGVSRSQLFAQARAGGWRRSDQPSAGMAALEAEVDDGAPAPPTAELAGEALRLGARAIARGRLHEAQGWIALAARLRALAKDERDPDAWGGVLEASGPPAAATPPAPTREPDADPTAATDLAQAVGRLAREGAALCERMEMGEDIEADARALEAQVAALEAGVADTTTDGDAWEWPSGPDGPAGLPPGGRSGGDTGHRPPSHGGAPAAASSACPPAEGRPGGAPPSPRPPSAP